jgi:hypothetical protein
MKHVPYFHWDINMLSPSQFRRASLIYLTGPYLRQNWSTIDQEVRRQALLSLVQDVGGYTGPWYASEIAPV